MAKIKIIKILIAIIFTALFVTSATSHAQDTGACVTCIGGGMGAGEHCFDTFPFNLEAFCADDLFDEAYFHQGEKCCQSTGKQNCLYSSPIIKTYVPDVQQGCCSKSSGTSCKSGVIDMGYYTTCAGYQCIAGNYVCNNGTCESSTLITLKDFKAYARSNRVILEWETETEIDNAGFNLYRSETENGNFIKINTSLITAQCSSTQGANYEFIDTNVQNRKTYYYKLEDIDLNGESIMHGPVSSTPRLIWSLWR